MKNKQVQNEQTTKEIMSLAQKRKDLILKVIGQLYKGKVGTLHFKNGSIYKVDYYTNYRKEERKTFSPFGNFEELQKELKKNLHDINDKFNEENMAILEFLMWKMDMEWDIKSKGILEEIKKDIQDIKDRCANYLLIMAIEESEQ